jgi:hypothetical protein
MTGIFGMIDPTITFGNILEIGAILGSGLVVLVRMNTTVSGLKFDVTAMQSEIKKLGDVLIQMAVTDTRLANAEQDIRDLQRGRGYIKPE